MRLLNERQRRTSRGGGAAGARERQLLYLE